MSTDTEKTIAAHRRNIELLKAQIDPLATEAARLRQLILELKSPFKVGDVIQWAYGRDKIRKGRVIEIIEWVCEDPMWRVILIKQDGTDGGIVEVRHYHNPTKVNQ